MSVEVLRTISISVNVVCILITILLMILYFSKMKIVTKENRIYDALLIVNFVALVFEFIF